MLRLYVSGPLTNVANSDVLKTFYEEIGLAAARVGFEAYVPHLFSDPVAHRSLSPQEVYELDRRHVIQADLVVAYVGIPAIGVGQEVEIAQQHGIPVVLAYECGVGVTRMIRGNPAVIKEIVEDNLTALIDAICRYFGQLRQKDQALRTALT